MAFVHRHQIFNVRLDKAVDIPVLKEILERTNVSVTLTLLVSIIDAFSIHQIIKDEKKIVVEGSLVLITGQFY